MKYRPIDIRRLLRCLEGVDAFVIGAGPSLHGFDFEQLRGRFTICLNHAVEYIPWGPHVHIFSDEALWKHWVRSIREPHTVVVCQDGAIARLEENRCKWRSQIAKFVRRNNPSHVKLGDEGLFVGSTVACGAIHLCWKMGARRVFLLGVDGFRRQEIYYADGSKHHKGDREIKRRGDDGQLLEERHLRWQNNMRDLRRHLDAVKAFQGKWPESGVYNLSPDSCIGTWEKLDLRRALRFSKQIRNEAGQDVPWYALEKGSLAVSDQEHDMTPEEEEALERLEGQKDEEIIPEIIPTITEVVREKPEDEVHHPPITLAPSTPPPPPEPKPRKKRRKPTPVPGLTVITATRDRPGGLSLCEEWLSRQTFKDFEWIVVDDGDVKAGKPELCTNYIERPASDAGMTYIQNLQEALPHARAPVVALVEDDAWREDTYLQKLMDGLEGHDMCFTAGFRLYNVKNRTYQDRTDDPKRILAKRSGVGSLNAVFKGRALNMLHQVVASGKFQARAFYRDLWARCSLNCVRTEMVEIKGISGRTFGARHTKIVGAPDPTVRVLQDWVGAEATRRILAHAETP